MSPLWCVAEVGFYAKDQEEADRMHEEMANVACRGDIGMGLHVCQRAFFAGMKQEAVDEHEFREACKRDYP